MTDADVDEIDEAIIYLLQQDARNVLAADMAERLPVSEGTVRNRLRKLEGRSVIEGYTPRVNYEAAGYPLKMVYSCRGRTDERAEMARRMVDVRGVINVREMTTGVHHVSAVAVAEDVDGMAAIGRKLTDLGLAVEARELMSREYVRPLDDFGRAVLDEGDDGEDDAD